MAEKRNSSDDCGQYEIVTRVTDGQGRIVAMGTSRTTPEVETLIRQWLRAQRAANRGWADLGRELGVSPQLVRYVLEQDRHAGIRIVEGFTRAVFGGDHGAMRRAAKRGSIPPPPKTHPNLSRAIMRLDGVLSPPTLARAASVPETTPDLSEVEWLAQLIAWEKAVALGL